MLIGHRPMPWMEVRAMNATSAVVGTSAVEGRLWSARADDWAAHLEGHFEPLYRAVLAELDVAGHSLLDVGCGAGRFLALAAAAGATVSGLDAAPRLLEIARRRVPDGRLMQGDIESLPFDDDSFDAVTGFNSFQYAADPRRALADARRVTRSGGRVVIAVWGAPERTEASGYLAALRAQLPSPPPGTPGPMALSNEAVLSGLVRDAGLTPDGFHAVSVPWTWADEGTALRGLISAGPAVRAIEAAGEEATRDAVRVAIAPYRRADGGYRLENEFVFLVARA
jgi:SAM-dependent methyltransferase